MVYSATNQMNPEQSSAPRDPTLRLAAVFHRTISAVALVSFVLVLATTLTDWRPPGKAGWPEALMLSSTVAATISALSRHLPLQNVLLASAVIAFIGGVAHAIGSATAIPFGPFEYTAAAGPRIAQHFSWIHPLLWVAIVLNSRGVARLILRPWRKVRSYGFWLMGITAALTVLTDAALEPFAIVVKRYWLWQSTRIPLTWCSAPVTNFFGWLLTAGLILAFATPALIDKRLRPKQSVPDYHPLIAWMLGIVLCGAGAATRELWIATSYCVALSIVTGIFAVRGGRW